ncbi:NADH:flavin oxidoreductase [Streptomyces asoensis]|uniref:NADH:flavin oxidoreductase n=1 Tax=Streptomyces asoensis TaxID=249586 RepID=UPI003407F5EB
MTGNTREHPALAPFALLGSTLSNRLAVAPMTRVSAAPDGTPTGQMRDYYTEYARGGFGLIITEGTYTDDVYSQGYLNQPGIVSHDHIQAWKKITTTVHAAGSRIILQLMHAGALSQGNRYVASTAGPSAVKPRGQKMADYGGSGPWDAPKEMTLDDIETVVTGFTTAALNARLAGFDGIEIHAANGYLLDQFLTDYTNQRTDDYGGTVERRTRLITEIVRRTKEAVADENFSIGVRISQTKVNDFEHRWANGAEDAHVIFSAIAKAGATYLHVASEGRDWIETARFDNGETITQIARKVSGLPVIANGGMHAPDQAADLLDGEHADILSIGRGALANPDLPRKLANNQPLEEFDFKMLHPMATLDSAHAWRQSKGK